MRKQHTSPLVWLANLLLAFSFTTPALADINVETAPDFHTFQEVLIDASPQEVWPYLIDMDSWIITHKVESYSGEPHTKGYVMKFTPNGYLSMPEKDRPANANHFGRAIRYDQYKNFQHTGYSYKGGSYGNFIFKDYVDFRLREQDGKTLLILNGMGLVGGGMTQEEVDKISASSSAAMRDNLLHLKKLVEQSKQ